MNQMIVPVIITPMASASDGVNPTITTAASDGTKNKTIPAAIPIYPITIRVLSIKSFRR